MEQSVKELHTSADEEQPILPEYNTNEKAVLARFDADISAAERLFKDFDALLHFYHDAK